MTDFETFERGVGGDVQAVCDWVYAELQTPLPVHVHPMVTPEVDRALSATMSSHRQELSSLISAQVTYPGDGLTAAIEAMCIHPEATGQQDLDAKDLEWFDRAEPVSDPPVCSADSEGFCVDHPIEVAGTPVDECDIVWPDRALARIMGDEGYEPWDTGPTRVFANWLYPDSAELLASGLGLPCWTLAFRETESGEYRAAAVAYSSTQIVAVIRPTDAVEVEGEPTTIVLSGIGEVEGGWDGHRFVGFYDEDMPVILYADGPPLQEVVGATRTRRSVECTTDCLY